MVIYVSRTVHAPAHSWPCFHWWLGKNAFLTTEPMHFDVWLKGQTVVSTTKVINWEVTLLIFVWPRSFKHKCFPLASRYYGTFPTSRWYLSSCFFISKIVDQPLDVYVVCSCLCKTHCKSTFLYWIVSTSTVCINILSIVFRTKPMIVMYVPYRYRYCTVRCTKSESW